MKKTFICNTQDIDEMKAKEFSIGEDPEKLELFIIKKNDVLYAYKNTCPHARVNLNWNKNQFLDFTETAIQCSLHFAQFTIETGRCFYGPCEGKTLDKIPLQIELNQVFLLNLDSISDRSL